MKKILLFCLGIGVALCVNAQSSFYFNLGPGLPQGEYKTNLNGIGFGGTLGFDFNIRKSILGAGFSIGYLNTGIKSEDKRFDAVITAGNVEIDRIPMRFNANISNNIILTHLTLRVTSPTEFIKVYGEGLIGFRYLFTATRITNETEKYKNYEYEENRITSKTQLGSYSFSYGCGLGLLIELGRNINLDLRGRYLLGTPAEYYNKEAIKDWEINFTTQPSSSTKLEPSNSLSAIPKKSELDMLFIELGLAFMF